jgi:hypothetical protein
MGDVLIRGVPEDTLRAIDDKARRAGLSRTEFLRRILARERTSADEVTVTDLARFTDRFADLADEDLMRRAWD